MRRMCANPRPEWRQLVEKQGLVFHTLDDGQSPYWDESAYYLLTAHEVDELERATYFLDRMCLAAVEHVLEENLLAQFGIHPRWRDWLIASWERDEQTVVGRFDLVYDGKSPPKMLEYNADTPTALLEAAVVQWYWLEEAKPGCDQFNSIHERLIERWKQLRADLPSAPIHFPCDSESSEDRGTVDYLRDTAIQADIEARALDISDIGWNGSRFVDLDEKPIDTLFKLYPWEWLVREEFCPHLHGRTTRVIEPAWKMLLSNKAILPVLWEMFPGHPNLLAASFEPGKFATDYVKKPIFSREGANVSINAGGRTVEEPGTYGAEGYIWQAYHELPRFGGNYTVIGSWIIGEEAAGIGIREDDSPITKNTSRFVPHYFS
jgi:glutathionylspermidine synthase